MIEKLMKALVISLFAHAAILWMFSLQTFNDYGVANGANKTTSSHPMTVKIIAAKPASAPLQLEAKEESAPVTTLEPPMKVAESMSSADTLLERKRTENYVSPGRLTRPPVPLEEVDLNVAPIDEVAVAGSFELTLLIDETGQVVDVLMPDDSNGTSLYASRVTERFKKARFVPGEINGISVKSRLPITVVSEPQAEPVRN